MARLFGYLAIIASLACGNKGSIDPAFSSYISDFEAKVGVAVSDLDMRFNALKAPYLGVCIHKTTTNEVQIDPAAWDRMEDPGRESLIFHELGHCVLGLSHNDTFVTVDGYYIEGSVMSTYWFGDRQYYKRYRERYKLALKNNTTIDRALYLTEYPAEATLKALGFAFGRRVDYFLGFILTPRTFYHPADQ